ncbi:hypothetical protein, partial [Enterobacter hormaechei]
FFFFRGTTFINTNYRCSDGYVFYTEKIFVFYFLFCIFGWDNPDFVEVVVGGVPLSPGVVRAAFSGEGRGLGGVASPVSGRSAPRAGHDRGISVFHQSVEW